MTPERNTRLLSLLKTMEEHHALLKAAYQEARDILVETTKIGDRLFPLYAFTQKNPPSPECELTLLTIDHKTSFNDHTLAVLAVLALHQESLSGKEIIKNIQTHFPEVTTNVSLLSSSIVTLQQKGLIKKPLQSAFFRLGITEPGLRLFKEIPILLLEEKEKELTSLVSQVVETPGIPSESPILQPEKDNILPFPDMSTKQGNIRSLFENNKKDASAVIPFEPVSSVTVPENLEPAKPSILQEPVSFEFGEDSLITLKILAKASYVKTARDLVKELKIHFKKNTNTTSLYSYLRPLIIRELIDVKFSKKIKINMYQINDKGRLYLNSLKTPNFTITSSVSPIHLSF